MSIPIIKCFIDLHCFRVRTEFGWMLGDRIVSLKPIAFCLLFISSAQIAFAEQCSCNEVLKYGIRDYVFSTTNNVEARASGNTSDSGATTAGDISIDVPGYASGDGSLSVSKWMNSSSYSEEDIQNVTKFFQTDTNNKVLSAWNTCQSTCNAGIKYTFDMSDENATNLAIGLTRTVEKQLHITKITTEPGTQCEIIGGVDGQLSVIPRDGGLSVNCSRSVEQVFEEDEFIGYRAGKIGALIYTDAEDGNIPVFASALNSMVLSREASAIYAALKKQTDNATSQGGFSVNGGIVGVPNSFPDVFVQTADESFAANVSTEDPRTAVMLPLDLKLSSRKGDVWEISFLGISQGFFWHSLRPPSALKAVTSPEISAYSSNWSPLRNVMLVCDTRGGEHQIKVGLWHNASSNQESLQIAEHRLVAKRISTVNQCQ